MPNIIVNLDVLVDATGNIQVFGASPPTMTNVIVASINLPYTDLYKAADNGLIKIKGNVEGNYDLIEGERNTSFTGPQSDLEADLKTILQAPFECSGATPFNDGTYTNTYSTQGSFGNVALSAYAHHLFGHIAATAAIDNDTSFVTKMNNDTLADARLNIALANEIYNLSVNKCTQIARQVIGQDASRVRSEDNDGSAPSDYQALEFKSGDIIYVSIKLLAPLVTVSNAAQINAPSATGYTDTTYNLKITLGAAFVGTRGGASPPTLAPNISYVSPQNLTVGSSVTITPTNSGGAATYTVSDNMVFDNSGGYMGTVPGLPAGLSINSSTGVITGYPASTTTITATVQASNGYGISQATIDFVVTAGLLPPNIEYTNPLNLTVGQAVTITPTNTGGAVQAAGYSLNFTPGGMTFNRNTGVLSGTPTSASSGTMIISAMNASGEDLEYINFTIVAASALASPSISYSNPLVITVDSTANVTPSNTGGTAIYSISPALPTGLAINSNSGAITGAPTTVQQSSIHTVSATNASGTSTFDINVEIARLITNGSMIWVAPITLTSSMSHQFSIGAITDAAGNVYTGGNIWKSSNNVVYSSNLSGSNSNVIPTIDMTSNKVAFLTKYNSNGAFQHAVSMITTGTFDHNPSFIGMCSDLSNNIYTCGQYGRPTGTSNIIFNSNMSSSNVNILPESTFGSCNTSNAFALKFNENGSNIAGFGLRADALTGTSVARTEAVQVRVATNGDIYLSGNYLAGASNCVYPYYNGVYGPSNVLPATSAFGWSTYLLKFNSAGVFQWTAAITTINTSGTVLFSNMNMAIDSENNIILTGIYNGASNNIYIYNSNMSSSNNNLIRSALSTAGDSYVAKVTPNGQIIALASIGAMTSDGATCATTDSNNNIYVCGVYNGVLSNVVSSNRSSSNTLHLQNVNYAGGVYAFKFNSNLEYQFNCRLTGALFGFACNSYSIAVGSNDKIYLSGYTSSCNNPQLNMASYSTTNTFIQNIIPYSPTTSGSYSFIASFDSNGVYENVTFIRGAQTTNARNISIKDNYIYTGGDYIGYGSNNIIYDVDYSKNYASNLLPNSTSELNPYVMKRRL